MIVLAARAQQQVPVIVPEFMAKMTDQRTIRLAERGPLPYEQAVGYVLQACEGLAEAHVSGIIHRDLKPPNLFVTNRPDGSELVKVLDYGLAKARSGAALPGCGPSG